VAWLAGTLFCGAETRSCPPRAEALKASRPITHQPSVRLTDFTFLDSSFPMILGWAEAPIMITAESLLSLDAGLSAEETVNGRSRRK
ncbi:MAG TPA: hypothetical protein VFR42_05505, partial [Candidatus Acidoferrum sp.]|nr:hypothetical protein [Candidatus Acidoferrum sp.]